ncbi:MAG: hypothetical protein U9Q81_13800 [Pseudomonadota bacterium]|nr:hypothetical protein [Pseudomonadota bacterium]
MLVRNPRGPLVRLVLIAAAIGLFLGGYYWGNQHKLGNAGPPTIEGVLVRPARELPDFELQDTDGLTFTAQDLREHWTLLAFGDLTQARGHLAVTRMIDASNRLADRQDLQADLQLALAADTQAPNLARDFSRLSRALKLLSGEAGELQRLRAALGAAPPGATTTADDGGAPFYLIGPRGRLVALFPSTQGPAAIAEDLTALADHPESLFPDIDE